MAEYLQTPENATSALNETGAVLVGNSAELGVLRMNWRTADPELLAALKAAMLADGTDQESPSGGRRSHGCCLAVRERCVVLGRTRGRVMRHDDAVALLRWLHTTQNHFYAGGELD